MASVAAPTLPPPSIDISQTLQRLLHDVTSFQLPDLLASKSTSQLAERERDLLSTLKRIDVELENFTLDCTDAGSDAGERAAWSAALDEARNRVMAVKRDAQSSLVRARQNVKAKARNALFEDMAESREERERRREANVADRSAEDKLMTASGDVTSALQRAVTMMSIELEKSSYSSQLLDESSMSIQQATLEYTSFTSLVSSSTKLIKSMERADFYDAILLSLSFAFFLLCIAYIVKVRVWDRGIGIISFFIRIIGLRSSTRSAGDVKEKLKLAKEAAKQLQSSISSSSSSSSSSSLAASLSSSLSSSSSLAASLSSSSKAAEMAKTALVNTVASVITTAYSDSAGHTIETPSVVSLESEQQPTHTTSIQMDRVHDEL